MQTQTSTIYEQTIERFPLGETYITPGAEEALIIAGQTAIEFLRLHMSCDFGSLSDEDIKENELSVREGFRILSSYRTTSGTRIWIITEADRSSTTIFLPAEY
jgi:hypothetical protein